VTPRERAIAVGVTRYHGRPCGRCGGTLRDTAGRHCVECEAARQRARYENLSGVEFNRLLLRRRRVQALRRMSERQGRR
jgi:hypothetical protein